ncbi:MAG: hypothetical protein P8176_15370 [Gammaproteobacteria bacterium]
MEPDAVNTLADEVESYRLKTLKELPTSSELRKLYSETSTLPRDEILGRWRLDERFDELVDYVIYQYEEGGGEFFWKQLLLDLRLKKDEGRAFRLLEGLLPKRLDKVKVCSKNLKKYPDNYLSAANLVIAKGEALKVLYEHAYILENKPADQIDKAKVKKVKTQIEKVLSA